MDFHAFCMIFSWLDAKGKESEKAKTAASKSPRILRFGAQPGLCERVGISLAGANGNNKKKFFAKIPYDLMNNNGFLYNYYKTKLKRYGRRETGNGRREAGDGKRETGDGTRGW